MVTRGKYLPEVKGRYDGSSKFLTNSKWGFFLGIGGVARVGGAVDAQRNGPGGI